MRRRTHRSEQTEPARGPRVVDSRSSEALYELRNENGSGLRATFALPRSPSRLHSSLSETAELAEAICCHSRGPRSRGTSSW